MAEGYLLSGFRIWIPDEQGNPLFEGRVSFFVAGTSTPATVYKDKELTTAWGTSVYTDAQGYLGDHSYGGVWLNQTHLYDCVVEKKIQEDPETWYPMWSIKNVGAIAKDEDEYGGTSAIVSNYQALKALSAAKYDYVYVAGWYTPGDTGAPMVFRWVEDSDADEDGHWVKPNSVSGNGRWEQMFYDGEIDPRKFGAIPDTSYSCDTAIDNAMHYASEPGNYSSANEKKFPKTVHFTAGGVYKILSNIDFSSYKMAEAYGSNAVPVIINDGVVFDGAKVTFGYSAKILASNPIITSSSTLEIVKGSMDYVRPQWWSGYSIWASIVTAVAQGHNVKVYGVGSNFSQSAGIYRVEGDGVIEFVDGSLKIDTENVHVYFKCLVKAAPNMSLVELPTGNMTTATARGEIKNRMPILFLNKSQVAYDGWFGLLEDMTGMNIDDFKGILLHWCLNSFSANVTGRFNIIGGYKISAEGVYASSTAICTFFDKITVKNCSVDNIYVEESRGQVVTCEGTGSIGFTNGTNYVEWFSSLDEAIANTADSQTLTSYSLSTLGNISSTEIKCKVKGLSFGISDDINIRNDFEGNEVACNGHYISFTSNIVNVNGNRFKRAQSIQLSNLSTPISISFNNNNVKFDDNSVSGYIGVNCTNTIPVKITNNNIESSSVLQRVYLNITSPINKNMVCVENNPGSYVDGRGSSKSLGGTISTSNGNLFFLRKLIREMKDGSYNDTWVNVARIARIPIQSQTNLFGESVLVDLRYLDNGLTSSLATSPSILVPYGSVPSSCFISQGATTKEFVDSCMAIRKSSVSQQVAGTHYFIMKSDGGTTDSDIESMSDWNQNFEFFAFTYTNLEGAYVMNVSTNTFLE